MSGMYTETQIAWRLALRSQWLESGYFDLWHTAHYRRLVLRVTCSLKWCQMVWSSRGLSRPTGQTVVLGTKQRRIKYVDIQSKILTYKTEYISIDWMTILLRIREVPSSIFSPEIYYSKLVPVSSQSLHKNAAAVHKLSLSLLLFSIVKIGLQQFSWTTDTWDIR
jgi:hypothetical protein